MSKIVRNDLVSFAISDIYSCKVKHVSNHVLTFRMEFIVVFFFMFYKNAPTNFSDLQQPSLFKVGKLRRFSFLSVTESSVNLFSHTTLAVPTEKTD